jgi:hypothetical protein
MPQDNGISVNQLFTHDELLRLVENFFRRFERCDLTDYPDLIAVADWYVRTYDGRRRFMCDLRKAVQRGQRLSVGQMAGALNCLRADLRKQRRGRRR